MCHCPSKSRCAVLPAAGLLTPAAWDSCRLARRSCRAAAASAAACRPPRFFMYSAVPAPAMARSATTTTGTTCGKMGTMPFAVNQGGRHPTQGSGKVKVGSVHHDSTAKHVQCKPAPKTTHDCDGCRVAGAASCIRCLAPPWRWRRLLLLAPGGRPWRRECICTAVPLVCHCACMGRARMHRLIIGRGRANRPAEWCAGVHLATGVPTQPGPPASPRHHPWDRHLSVAWHPAPEPGTKSS